MNLQGVILNRSFAVTFRECFVGFGSKFVLKHAAEKLRHDFNGANHLVELVHDFLWDVT